ALALGLAGGRPRALVVPVATYFALCLFTRLNMGHRYLLPMYPFLIALAGRVVVAPSRTVRALGWGLTLGSIGCVLAAHPNELAYLNRVAGPPEIAWTRLTNSNVDWGQDIPALAQYQRQHDLGPIYADVDAGALGAADQGVLTLLRPPGDHPADGWLA